MYYSLNTRKIANFLKNIDCLNRVFQLTKPPILIGGCGRSGTTLLLSILGAHPKIQAIDHETYLFLPPRSLKNDILRDLRITFNLLQERIKPTARRWCEKTPSNILKLNEIDDYFRGNYRFIHLIRDGRDVVTSKHPIDPNRYWVDIDRWVNDVKTGLEYSEHPNVISVNYENIILNFKQSMKEICEFIGEEFRWELTEFQRKTSVKNDRAWSGTVRELSSDSIGRWKDDQYTARINAFYQNQEAVALLDKLGYEI